MPGHRLGSGPFAVQRHAWQLIRSYLGPAARRLPLVTALSIGAALSQVLTLVMLASAAVGLAGGKHTLRVAPGPFVFHLPVATVMIISAVAAVGMIAFQVSNGWVASGLAVRAQTQCRRQVIDAYTAASWELVSTERRGELQQLLTAHMAKVALTVSYLNILVLGLCNVTILVAAAVLMDPLVALVLAVGVNVVTLPLRPIKARTRRLARRQGEAEADFAAHLAGIVEQARETQLFEVRDGVSELGRPLTNRLDSAQRRVTFLLWVAPAAYAGLALLGFVGALSLLAVLHIGDLSSTGALVLLLLRSLSYAQQVQGSMQNLAETDPYLREIEKRRAKYQQQPRRSGLRPLETIQSVELRHVSYRYPSSGAAALYDMNLLFGRGTLIGIVGPTGSGKSTLAQILLRLREPVSGSYLINGIDVREYDRESWARVVAFVPQEPMIVDGTVADNIRFFRPWIEDAAIREAARAAHIAEEIEELPEGFATRLSGISVGLSGGQRQRLCIARALVGSPQMLVLDEPTSALDMKSEALFQQTIQSLVGRTTVAVIAHRPATIRRCERIVVVERGHIRAFDTPERLLAEKGFFAEIAKLG